MADDDQLVGMQVDDGKGGDIRLMEDGLEGEEGHTVSNNPGAAMVVPVEIGDDTRVLVDEGEDGIGGPWAITTRGSAAAWQCPILFLSFL